MSTEPERRARRHPALSRVWSIVLSGGEGTRLSPLIRLWRGEHVPKQYCAFSGRRSMLEHTLRRAVHVSPPERTLTVISRGHRRFMSPELQARCGRILEQPVNRETAAGIFLPVAHVMAARARTLWELGRRHLPEMLDAFSVLRRAAGTRREEAVMSLVYAGLKSANFSKDVLRKAPRRILVVPMRGVQWSDWGRPERIVETLGSVGLAPAFPLALMARAAA